MIYGNGQLKYMKWSIVVPVSWLQYVVCVWNLQQPNEIASAYPEKKGLELTFFVDKIRLLNGVFVGRKKTTASQDLGLGLR